MARCIEFYQRWEKDPNWCEKCPDAVRKIDRYMDLLEVMEARGVAKADTIVRLPEGAARPLIGIRNDETRAMAISHIEMALKRETPQGGRYHEKIPVALVKKIIRDVEMAPRRAELQERAKAADLPGGINLIAGDFLTGYGQLGTGSVDCIITDPPYVKEWIENYGPFAKAAASVLKPGGFLITYVGHIHLDKILAAMTPHLDFYWICALLHSGTVRAVHSRSVQCGFKPILIFNKPPRAHPKRYFNDLIKGTGREKGAHEWQQGEEELKAIFEPFTDPGDLVLDPFMGSGTVISMAKRMGRRAVGFDINPENVEVVKGRLAE
jgi:hypothetical protein